MLYCWSYADIFLTKNIYRLFHIVPISFVQCYLGIVVEYLLMTPNTFINYYRVWLEVMKKYKSAINKCFLVQSQTLDSICNIESSFFCFHFLVKVLICILGARFPSKYYSSSPQYLHILFFYVIWLTGITYSYFMKVDQRLERKCRQEMGTFLKPKPRQE